MFWIYDRQQKTQNNHSKMNPTFIVDVEIKFSFKSIKVNSKLWWEMRSQRNWLKVQLSNGKLVRSSPPSYWKLIRSHPGAVISVISMTARPNSQPQSAHSQTAVNRLPRKSLITANQIYIFITDNTITHPKRQLCELWKYGRTETSFIRHNCNCSWFRLLDIVVGDIVSADLGLFWESFWWMGIRTGLFRSMEGVQEIELWPGDLRQWVSFPRFR